MPVQADTNDARAYYDFAMDLLGRDDAKAADALYWATRLEPTWADAFYARRIALLLSDRPRLTRYWAGDKHTIQSDDVRRIDSLFYHALTLDPFVSQRLDRRLIEAVTDEIAMRNGRENGGDAGEIRALVDREMNAWPAANRARLAYGDGRYSDALRLYAAAIESDETNGALHADRARIFFDMHEPDSASAEFAAASRDLRTRAGKDVVPVYQSAALAEHGIGVIQSRLGHAAAAKAAYDRALQDDPSYYPAHLQLARLALDAKDTATAVAEVNLAAQLRPNDATVRYACGATLAELGRASQAEMHLRRAADLNAVYAAPHFLLARVLEAQGKKADAVAEYRVFLARAARGDMRRAEAESRLRSVASSVGQEPR
ncbi:MAG: tetratricopeptide repeat protein [Gemmatimonadaceae bacterium]